MKAYVGVTDSRWSSFLATRPYLNEVNFWVPGGGPRAWRVTAPNDVVLFKSKAPSNVIVGGGIHTDYRQLPVSLAWDVWGEGNGAGSLEEMRQLIGLNRHAPIAHSEDPVVGCLMLRDVAFFDESEPMSAPENFAANIVSGKGYALRPGGTSAVELAVARLLDGRASMSEVRMDRQEVEFAPRLVWGRLVRKVSKPASRPPTACGARSPGRRSCLSFRLRTSNRWQREVSTASTTDCCCGQMSTSCSTGGCWASIPQRPTFRSARCCAAPSAMAKSSTNVPVSQSRSRRAFRIDPIGSS